MYERKGGEHMILRDIIAQLRLAAPEELAQEWDNVGLLVGDDTQDIRGIYIALDADEAAIAEAKAVGAELLLTHHPLIFSPLKKITGDSFTGARIVALLQSHMRCYAMHTNFDVSHMGRLAAKRIGLRVERPLADIVTRDGIDYGIGVVGNLDETCTLRAFGELVKERFGACSVKLFGEPQAQIRRAAVCPGSGKGPIGDALRAGADVLLTGDIDHHSGIDAVAQGLCIIDAGHYGLEHIFIGCMEQYLRERLDGVAITAQAHREPYSIV